MIIIIIIIIITKNTYAKYRQQSLEYNTPIIIVFEENSLSQFPFTQCELKSRGCSELKTRQKQYYA